MLGDRGYCKENVMERKSISEILQKIRKDAQRVVALGISTERQNEYYRQLSTDCDPDKDEWAFANATAGLTLAVDDLAFIKTVLDSGDPR
jgi:hypothetical protein